MLITAESTGSMSRDRSEEHTSELQSRSDLVCRLLLEKKKKKQHTHPHLPHHQYTRRTLAHPASTALPALPAPIPASTAAVPHVRPYQRVSPVRRSHAS